MEVRFHRPTFSNETCEVGFPKELIGVRSVQLSASRFSKTTTTQPISLTSEFNNNGARTVRTSHPLLYSSSLDSAPSPSSSRARLDQRNPTRGVSRISTEFLPCLALSGYPSHAQSASA